jgi:hypothetical protein
MKTAQFTQANTETLQELTDFIWRSEKGNVFMLVGDVSGFFNNHTPRL